MHYYMGIDPGATGAFALVDQDGKNPIAVTYPGTPQALALEISNLIGQIDGGICQCALELVHAMPGQGVSSCFKFGSNFGIWQGILSAFAIPYMLVTPQKWQKTIFDSSKRGETKAQAIEYVTRQYPHMTFKKKDSGRADAICMALYARKVSLTSDL